MPAMQTFLGIVLGVFLTVGAAFLYDSGRARSKWLNSSFSRRACTDGELGHRGVRWDSVKQRLREVTVDVEKGLKRIAG